MKLSEAIQTVLEDTRQAYTPSEMSDAECLVHAYNTVSSTTLDESDPDNALAYHAFLNAMGDLMYGSQGPHLSPAQAAKELLAH